MKETLGFVSGFDASLERFLQEVLVSEFLHETVLLPSRFSADDWGDVTIIFEKDFGPYGGTKDMRLPARRRGHAIEQVETRRQRP